MNGVIDKAARALREFDSSQAEANIETALATISECENAKLRAGQRIAAITEEMASHSNIGGVDVADRLVAQVQVTLARPDVDALRDEQDLLRQGMVELNRRISTAQNDIRRERDNVKKATGPLLDTFGDDLENEAVNLATRLAEIYAVADTMRRAVNSNSLSNLQRKLEPVIEATHRGGGKIVPAVEPIDVPANVRPIIEALQGIGPLNAYISPSVTLPRDFPRE